MECEELFPPHQLPHYNTIVIAEKGHNFVALDIYWTVLALVRLPTTLRRENLICLDFNCLGFGCPIEMPIFCLASSGKLMLTVGYLLNRGC